MNVSIITITYNADQFLEKTMLSVLNQSCDDYEYLIIDGGSSDLTVDIIKKYDKKIDAGEFASVSKDRFRWISEPDNGLYDAMNKGLDIARGDFVWFINAGDKIYNNETLQSIVNSYNQASICDIIYGQSIVIDEDDNIVGERHKRAPRKLKFTSLLNGLLVCHQSILVRKSIALKYDLQYRISADYDWVCSAVRKSKSNVYVDNYISQFMTSGVSSVHRKKSWIERFYIMKKHFGIIRTILAHVKIIILYPLSIKN